ncbi:MAG: PepSY domain-containing protein [Gammaproteobacteria bacterium]|nr:PepSY domain-containing protein [Gammaproteobacteria bacterium]
MQNLDYFGSRNKKAGVTASYTGHLLIILVLVCTSFNSIADNRRNAERQPTQARQQRGISAGQAAAKAQRQYGGEVLKVSREGNQYRVKLLLPSGMVKNVYISAD